MTRQVNKAEPDLYWTSHPLLDFPRTSLVLILFILLIGTGLWKIAVVFWEMPLFYYLGMTIFIFSLINYFIPTTYKFFENRIEVIYWFIKIEKKYDDFGCFYTDKKGVMLSTFKIPRRLDPFRGLSIRFSKSQKEKNKLIQILEEKVGKRY